LPEGIDPNDDGKTPTCDEVRQSFLGGEHDWRADLCLVLGEQTLRALAATDAEVRKGRGGQG
jgi:hypothetical protein